MRGLVESTGRSVLVARSAGDSQGREFYAISDAELGVHVRQVCLDGGPAHEEPGPDLGIRKALGDQADDVEFGAGEAGPALRRPAAAAAPRVA